MLNLFLSLSHIHQSPPPLSEDRVIAPVTTYEPINRVMNSEEVDQQLLENSEYFDLTAEFAKYGLTPESVPY